MNKDLQAMDISLPISSLDAYITHVNQIPMLTQEEEQDLATRLQVNGEIAAAKPLILAHTKYVVKVARGYAGYGLPLGDLIQEGNVGLMKAVKRFDPKVGVRLVTFAVHWIKSEIHEYILRNWKIVKVATTKAQRKLFFNLRSMKKRLGWFTNEEVNFVAKDLGVEPKTVREMEMRLSSIDATFDYSADESDEKPGFAPVAYLEDKRYNPADLIEASDWSKQSESNLHAAMKDLDERSQQILAARWLSDEKSTLQDLAEKYNVSAERIRQLEKNAMNKLKKVLDYQES